METTSVVQFKLAGFRERQSTLFVAESKEQEHLSTLRRNDALA
jgi:hypothetical protein